MRQDLKVYFVYTQQRIDTGQRPYLVFWGKSAKALVARWFKKYGIPAVKVVPGYWNIETAQYEPEE